MSAGRLRETLLAVAQHFEDIAYELRMYVADPPAAPRVNLERVLALSLDDLEFSVRTTNCLRTAGLVTVGDVAARSVSDLRSIRHFGRKSFNEVREVLANLGVPFAPETTVQETDR